MAKNKLDIKMNLPNDAELKRMFDAVPKLNRYEVSDATVRAGGRIIVKRAKELAPRGNQADRNKRSKSQRAGANWDIRLRSTIAMVVRKYRNAKGLAVVGPKWPQGNKAYFDTSPGGREKVLWGRRTGQTIPQLRNWIVKAFDETRSQQLAAMKSKLRQKMDQVWRG